MNEYLLKITVQSNYLRSCSILMSADSVYNINCYSLNRISNRPLTIQYSEELKLIFYALLVEQ